MQSNYFHHDARGLYTDVQYRDAAIYSAVVPLSLIIFIAQALLHLSQIFSTRRAF